MRRQLCGWTVALAIAQRPCHADEGRSVPSTQRPQQANIQSRGGSAAFAVPASLFVAPSPAAGGGFVGRRGFGGRRKRNRGCSGVASRLEAKKSEVKAEEAEFRAAAKELAKMEAKKEKKTKDRARRREEKKPRPPKGRVGDAQDDVLPLGKAGQNPFRRDKIVSKFDVNDIRKVEFVGSYDDKEEIWPRTNLPEIAFLGRSNVGKSSMLNTLFGEAVAKVSKTPGRTRQINIFKAKNSNDKDVCYFADLPGYGYAKMSKDKQRTIEKFLDMYLERRSNLKLLILLADSRREPLASDAGVLEYAEDKEDRLYKILLVATKVDKLSTMESVVNIKRLQEAFELPPGLPVSFSAVTGQGKKEICLALAYGFGSRVDMVGGHPSRMAGRRSSFTGEGDRVYTLKFVLAGSRGVGKTQLASLFHKKHGGYPSVGMQFATRTLRYAEHSCLQAQIWDTAGRFPFKSVTDAFFQGAVGAMLVYDISRRSTFDDLTHWLALVRENCHESVALILVGNKSDMSSKQREVSMVEGMRFARKHGLDFLETSALEEQHVEEACRQLIMSVARYLPQEKCVWSKHEPSYPLPAGWVTIAPGDGDDDEDTDDRESFHPGSPDSIGKAGDIDTDSDSTDVASTDTNSMPPPPPPPPPPPNRTMSKIFAAGSHSPQQRRERHRRTSSDSTAAISSTTTTNTAAATTEPSAVVTGEAIGARARAKSRGSFGSPPRVSWYENIWTGERVSRRPVYPAGPSEACVVTQVPRALDPLSFLADPVKGDGAERAREVVGKTSSWSFSSFRVRGVARAAQCLSQCVDPA
eukprot:g12194.t1